MSESYELCVYPLEANPLQHIKYKISKKESILGRNKFKCDVPLIFSDVSDVHAKLSINGPNDITIRDLNSDMGIYLVDSQSGNKQRINPGKDYDITPDVPFYISRYKCVFCESQKSVRESKSEEAVGQAGSLKKNLPAYAKKFKPKPSSQTDPKEDMEDKVFKTKIQEENQKRLRELQEIEENFPEEENEKEENPGKKELKHDLSISEEEKESSSKIDDKIKSFPKPKSLKGLKVSNLKRMNSINSNQEEELEKETKKMQTSQGQPILDKANENDLMKPSAQQAEQDNNKYKKLQLNTHPNDETENHKSKLLITKQASDFDLLKKNQIKKSENPSFSSDNPQLTKKTLQTEQTQKIQNKNKNDNISISSEEHENSEKQIRKPDKTKKTLDDGLVKSQKLHDMTKPLLKKKASENEFEKNAHRIEKKERKVSLSSNEENDQVNQSENEEKDDREKQEKEPILSNLSSKEIDKKALKKKPIEIEDEEPFQRNKISYKETEKNDPRQKAIKVEEETEPKKNEVKNKKNNKNLPSEKNYEKTKEEIINEADSEEKKPEKSIKFSKKPEDKQEKFPRKKHVLLNTQKVPVQISEEKEVQEKPPKSEEIFDRFQYNKRIKEPPSEDDYKPSEREESPSEKENSESKERMPKKKSSDSPKKNEKKPKQKKTHKENDSQIPKGLQEKKNQPKSTSTQLIQVKAKKPTITEQDQSDLDKNENDQTPTKKSPIPKKSFSQRKKRIKIGISGFILEEDEIFRLKSLGMKIIENKSKPIDYLILKSFKRTIRFLMSINKGINIIDKKWLDESIEKEEIQDPLNYLFFDKMSEKSFGFKLQESLAKARETKEGLFFEYSFWISANVSPSFEEIKLLVTSGGGTCLNKKPLKDRKNIFLIMSTDEAEKIKALKLEGYKIYSTEFIFSACLRQKLELDKNLI